MEIAPMLNVIYLYETQWGSKIYFSIFFCVRSLLSSTVRKRVYYVCYRNEYTHDFSNINWPTFCQNRLLCVNWDMNFSHLTTVFCRCLIFNDNIRMSLSLIKTMMGSTKKGFSFPSIVCNEPNKTKNYFLDFFCLQWAYLSKLLTLNV